MNKISKNLIMYDVKRCGMYDEDVRCTMYDVRCTMLRKNPGIDIVHRTSHIVHYFKAH
jgi:hypothetical protein